ncbi:FkbM family methyltransferase [Mesorhizobium sp.]|uniref:FkbM family methyltransferase n=1 Tax=Mesorhizobium sp. TaxID=1871066 RepID=UPI000FE9B6D9|nr:FkbM family methyltransferase [Mesorhizobium sp.]RWI98824.1 MAG: FkbM family methyltransferase [Mesorhizobium sp.]TIQ07195.1 MAG: FkbM family methyltransferase [Mesorhizobium sp.]TIR23449.1 MAG: FkbM family methyltransferase [Mesorhizobium sp.]
MNGFEAQTEKRNLALFQEYVARDRKAYGFSIDFLITDQVAQDWYGPQNQEMIERLWCVENLRPGMVAVDCGAHHGMMTALFAKRVGPQGLVHAFELLPANANVITRNVALNRLGNVRVVPAGVSEFSSVDRAQTQQGNAVLHNEGDAIVRLVSLDEEFGGRIKIDFLKLDVEGCELAALRGARKTLAHSRPLIDLEIHSFLFADPEKEVAAIFDEVGPKWRFGVSDNQSPIEDMGSAPDIQRIAGMFNPHVFLTPC